MQLVYTGLALTIVGFITVLCGGIFIFRSGRHLRNENIARWSKGNTVGLCLAVVSHASLQLQLELIDSYNTRR